MGSICVFETERVGGINTVNCFESCSEGREESRSIWEVSVYLGVVLPRILTIQLGLHLAFDLKLSSQYERWSSNIIAKEASRKCSCNFYTIVSSNWKNNYEAKNIVFVDFAEDFLWMNLISLIPVSNYCPRIHIL